MTLISLLNPQKIAARLNLKTDDVLSSIKQGDFRLLKELAPSTDRLAEIYNAGVSLNRLVDKTGMQRDHLEAALRSQGAVLRGRADAARLKPLNYNFFDIIDSKDKAFLLLCYYAPFYNTAHSTTKHLCTD